MHSLVADTDVGPSLGELQIGVAGTPATHAAAAAFFASFSMMEVGCISAPFPAHRLTLLQPVLAARRPQIDTSQLRCIPHRSSAQHSALIETDEPCVRSHPKPNPRATPSCLFGCCRCARSISGGVLREALPAKLGAQLGIVSGTVLTLFGVVQLRAALA